MPRKNIILPNVGEPEDARVGCQCIKQGNHVFISGQIAYNNGKLVGAGDPLEQCRECFRHIADYMEACGGSLDDVMSLDIYLSDIRYRQAAIDARAEVFSAPGPSATVVGGVDFAFEDLLVEISAVAILS